MNKNKEVERIIAFLEEARNSHLEWIVWLTEARACCVRCSTKADLLAETAGDVVHQEEWVENYDIVLKYIRGGGSSD